MTDQQTLAAIRQDDTEALQAIYKRYETDFLRWVQTYFGIGNDDAQDIFQESVVALYLNIKHGKLTELSSSLKTYLFAIGRHVALRKVRGQKPDLPLEDFTHLPALPESADVFRLSDRQLVLGQALARLGSPCKDILQYFYFDNFGMEVIAERMGYKNESVVRAQKVRCLKSLKVLLGENPMAE